jgi:thymidylate kinase
MRSEGDALKFNSGELPIAADGRPSLALSASKVLLPAKAITQKLFDTLEQQGINYCHWKSNIRLEKTLAGSEDIDILVDRRDAGRLDAVLLAGGFKLAQSRSGVSHPGVFHAIGLDDVTAELVDVHAYFQVVSGDSLVKNYCFPIEDALLDRARYLNGVRVPAPEAELVVFALRIALKHISPVEILKANRRYWKISQEMAWLRNAANGEATEMLCAKWFPSIDTALFRQLLNAIEDDRAVLRRVFLGLRVARGLRNLRRLSVFSAMTSRYWRLLSFLVGRFRRRRDLALQTGGMIVALVGPKGTGKSTLGHELAARLSKHLDVTRIHAGKPPTTMLSILPRQFIPIARSLLPNERLAEYEKPERRSGRRYSLLHVVRMTLVAFDRHKLLRRAHRAAAAGTIVISDRYPSETVGASDSSCFDDIAVENCGSRLKRWLMTKERAFYRALPRPHLVLRLVAPVDTAVQRDALRSKMGGPNAEAVRRRWERESHGEFPGTRVIEIDTSLSLDDTLRNVVRTVWGAL